MADTEVVDLADVRENLATIVSELAKDKQDVLLAFNQMTMGESESMIEWIRHGLEVNTQKIGECFAEAGEPTEAAEGDELSWVSEKQREGVEKILNGEGGWREWVIAAMTAESPDWRQQDEQARGATLDALVSKLSLSMEELTTLHENTADFIKEVLIPAMEEDKELMMSLSQEDVEEVLQRVLQQ